jgi:biopolymer transport protein ExbD
MDLGGAKGGLKADINVTPLVDVMLVLLVIMMLIAPLLQQGVSVKLPTAGNTTDKPETQGQTVVAIAKDKQMYLNTKPVKDDELGMKVSDLLEGQKEKIVIIKGDGEVNYGVIMTALDQLRRAGIEDIALIVDPKRTPGGQSAGGQ